VLFFLHVKGISDFVDRAINILSFMEIRPMEAKVMIVEGKRTKGLRKRDVVNRHFALLRMRG
jgi:hypothetical protein